MLPKNALSWPAGVVISGASGLVVLLGEEVSSSKAFRPSKRSLSGALALPTLCSCNPSAVSGAGNVWMEKESKLSLMVGVIVVPAFMECKIKALSSDTREWPIVLSLVSSTHSMARRRDSRYLDFGGLDHFAISIRP